MNFSFELEGQALTGSINPETMVGMTTVLGALFGGIAILWIVVSLAIAVFMIISRWRVFKKANLPGRGYLIPVYNRVLIFKLGGLSGRWTLSILFPPLFIVMMIINYFNIAKNFGKHWAYGLGILFFSIVFIPILAFDDSKYLGKKAKSVSKVIAKPVAKAPMKKVVKKAPTTAGKPVKKVKTLKKKK